MPPLLASTISQITSRGPEIQAENRLATINQVVCGKKGGNPVRSAYLHVPFCFHKCHYCDFYSIVDSRDRQAEFVDRLVEEMAAATVYLDPPLETIFIGGGTPTLLAVPLWERLLKAMRQHLPLAPDGEFTVEANPETVTVELLKVLSDGGVNRVSVGCQSFNPHHLKTLERWHDPANVHRTVKLLRGAGIENFNLDLIFAIPGQTLEQWLNDLEQAIALRPAHISCYGLVYEPNTPMTVKMRSGRITPCDQDLEAAMYHAMRERLADADYEHYEISNWARRESQELPSRRCRHNMVYWSNRNWWALGPSASGHVNGLRWKNVARLGEYLERRPWPAITDVEQVDEDARIGEAFMLGLRLVEGLPVERVEELLASGTRGPQRRHALGQHESARLLERRDGRWRFTPTGLMLADTVLADLL